MEVSAKVKYIRMSPRKVRLVASLIRGQKLEAALDQLNHTNKLAVKPIIKLINSAIANAENNFELKKDNLIIKTITVNEGPTLRRWKPRARGRATPVRKRTSHVEVVLSELVDSGEKKAKKQKLEAPVKLGEKPKEDEGVKVSGKDDKKSSAKATDDKGEEKGKKIVDPRSEGRGKPTKIEGKGRKGFMGKMFRRKSG